MNYIPKVNPFKKDVQFMIDRVDHAHFKMDQDWNYNPKKGCFEKVQQV